jgi:hypothetical protein
MTSNQFQIQKEIQAKEINIILQAVKLNAFPKEAKIKVAELGEKAINLISALRKEVYKHIDKFDFEIEDYDHTKISAGN